LHEGPPVVAPADLRRETERASWGLRRGDDIDDTLVVIDDLRGGSRYEVFSAWDRSLFCKVAVKVLRPDRVDSERSLASFEREAQVSSGLAHPNLVRLLRWSPALPRPYLVLEFITAPTLGELLDREHRLSVPETVLLAIRMLSALHYLHSRSLLHLDVKPSNVTTGDPPRLLDLSIARFAPGPLRLRHSIGTPQYMAPEQCTHGHVTPATDVFGLGATLYEALTGMAPFRPGDDEAREREERYPQLVEDPHPVLDLMPECPRDLAGFVMACIERDPGLRPASAIDAAIALERILEGMGHGALLAWPKGLPVRPAR
jgi:serine/threonine protein kinase